MCLVFNALGGSTRIIGRGKLWLAMSTLGKPPLIIGGTILSSDGFVLGRVSVETVETLDDAVAMAVAMEMAV